MGYLIGIGLFFGVVSVWWLGYRFLKTILEIAVNRGYIESYAFYGDGTPMDGTKVYSNGDKGAVIRSEDYRKWETVCGLWPLAITFYLPLLLTERLIFDPFVKYIGKPISNKFDKLENLVVAKVEEKLDNIALTKMEQDLAANGGEIISKTNVRIDNFNKSSEDKLLQLEQENASLKKELSQYKGYRG